MTLPKITTRTITIAGSVLVSAGMITGAFALSGPLPFTSPIKKADAQSTAELLKAFAAKDSDSDGLPDWEESLYGTDPLNAQSVQTGLTDAEAVAQGLVKPRFVTEVSEQNRQNVTEDMPGVLAASNSVTDRFAQAFFKNYMATRGDGQPTEEQVLQFAESAVADLRTSNAPAQEYSISDVRTGTGGAAAVKEYIAAVEAAFLKFPTRAGSPELEYVTLAVTGGDTSSLDKARGIAQNYMRQADELMLIPVPPEARLMHLALANSVHALGVITENMAAMDTDPMLGMLGIIEYQPAAFEAIEALAAYAGLANNNQVFLLKGEAGADFINRANIVSELLQAGQAGQL